MNCSNKQKNNSRTSVGLLNIAEKDKETLKSEIKPKNKISKYDMIKIKVRLGQHWFIFSRYILSNILKVIHIHDKEAEKLAYELKKKFIEQGLFEITLQDFQEKLFELFRENEYDEIYKNRYLMMNKFYSNRVPLIILISGTLLVGKSSIANRLSERINISNVLQTKIVSIVMSSISNSYSFPIFWKNKNKDECLNQYINECKIIRKGCSLDMIKAFKEGKPVILEGHHIIPKFYIDKDDKGLYFTLPEYEDESKHENSIRVDINSLHSMRGLIIPILLTVDEDSHMSFIRNSGNFIKEEEQSYSLNVFRKIQQYLIDENNYFTEVKVKYNKEEEAIESIHRMIIDKIELSYKDKVF